MPRTLLTAAILLMALAAAGAEESLLDEEGELSVQLPKGETMKFVWIEPGTFLMGATKDEVSPTSDELPQHEVTISRGFFLAKHELTQEQWASLMETRPWRDQRFARDWRSYPAVYISWEDVLEFIDRMNEWAGADIYRLPTEAEWEYAARAGSTDPWSFGDRLRDLVRYAWFDSNAWRAGNQFGHPVGLLMPNSWGLYDMHGNVWEWVQDWYGDYGEAPQVDPPGPAAGTLRVTRGGGFTDGYEDQRSASRSANLPVDRFSNVGARILMVDAPTAVKLDSWGRIKSRAKGSDSPARD